MAGNARKLKKRFVEMLNMGAVQLKTAQEAVALRKYARAKRRVVTLRREEWGWVLYDAEPLMGEVV